MAPAETPSGFLRIAQRDFHAANRMVDASLFYEEHWGFQSQQATEKALKTWLLVLQLCADLLAHAGASQA